MVYLFYMHNQLPKMEHGLQDLKPASSLFLGWHAPTSWAMDRIWILEIVAQPLEEYQFVVFE